MSQCQLHMSVYVNNEQLIYQYICDAARVWGRPKATKHTKNASYQGGRAAN